MNSGGLDRSRFISNSRALVTGAAGGIGSAVVRQLAEENVEVFATDLSEGQLERSLPAGVDRMSADLTDPEARTSLLNRVGTVHYLVNAAGVVEMNRIALATPAEWHRMMTVNAESMFFLCQAMCNRIEDGGAIVNVASIAAWTGEEHAAIYAASKAVVVSLTRSFSRALASRGVRVNSVSPGIVDTPMQGKFLPVLSNILGEPREELQRRRLNEVPLKRAAKAEECAAAICFLLSQEATYITGEDVNISGGLRLC